MGVKVNFTDNSEHIRSAFEKQVSLGLWAIGASAEGYAKRGCPVDTGRLRNSITHRAEDSDVYIGTNVEYAPYVEYTHKEKAHFLRNAATTHNDEYESIMKTALKG